MNLQKALVGHWTMDDRDTSGGTLYDRSAYDNHGGLGRGITKSQSGIVGDSFSFDGTNDYIPTELFYNTASLTEVAVSFWYKSSTVSEQIIVSSDRNEYWRVGIGSDSTDGILWTVSSSDKVSSISQTELQNGEWHHIVVSFDASLANDHKMFVNGSLDSEFNVYSGGIGSNNTSYTFIGTGSEASTFDGSNGPNQFIDGYLSDVRVYHRGLTLSDARELYNMREQKTRSV